MVGAANHEHGLVGVLVHQSLHKRVRLHNLLERNMRLKVMCQVHGAVTLVAAAAVGDEEIRHFLQPAVLSLQHADRTERFRENNRALF